MGSRHWICGLCLGCFLFARAGEAQWRDPKLIAGQVGFNIAISFVGKMVVHHESPKRAFKQALKEGTVSGLMAHGGYSIAAQNPNLALVGQSACTEVELDDTPFDPRLSGFRRISVHQLGVDALVRPLQVGRLAAPRARRHQRRVLRYYVFSDQYTFDTKRTLTSGSLVFLNRDPPPGLRGYYVLGVIWIDATRDDAQWVLSHEIVHSLQAERGSAIKEWHHENIRFNWLVFASGVPAMLAGWPEHDT